MKFLYSSIVVALAFTTVSAAAQQPAPPVAAQASSDQNVELARRFVTLTLSPDKYIGLMRTGMTIAATQHIEASDEAGRLAAKKEIDSFLAVLEPKVREHLPTILDAFAQVYAREFTTPELEQMIAFAQSPAGQHYMTKREFLDVDPSVQASEQELMADIMSATEQLKKQKCAARAAQRVAMGEKNAKCPLAAKRATEAG